MLKIILAPFSMLYGLVLWIRNKLYDWGVFSSVVFPVPVISIGNINVGGTGKTPAVDYLLAHFKNDYTIAVVSRGYGRKSKGYKEVTLDAQAKDVGDEPLLLKVQNPDVTVVVSENRAAGIEQVRRAYPQISLIVLDDAFQHRGVKPYINIVLTTYQNPFFRDIPLPGGRLREFPSAVQRADAVIVTKCPATDAEPFQGRIKKRPLFSSGLVYNYDAVSTEVYGFSGLANNGVFQEFLAKHHKLDGFKGFPDHHEYTKADVAALTQAAKGNPLVCTMKDFVKLQGMKETDEITAVPIKMKINQELEFLEWITLKLEQFES